MKTTTTQFLKACSLSVALLGSAAVLMAVSVPDAAYANNGKGNGNGGGNGGGNGNGSGGGNGNGGGNGSDKSNAGGNGGGNDSAGGNSGGNGKSVDFSKSGKAAEKKAAKKKVAKVEAPEPTVVGEAKTGKIKLKGIEGDGYAHPSELGALNAAHANPRALENAAPNSRVGRIAAYRDLVLDGRELAADLDEKTKLFESLEEPERTVEAIDEAIGLSAIEVEAKAEAVKTLEEALAEAGGVDAGIEEDLLAARIALTEAEEAAQALEDERTAAVEYAALDDEITELTEQLEAQPEAETEALQAAANKEVTDDVEATVKKLLGL